MEKYTAFEKYIKSALGRLTNTEFTNHPNDSALAFGFAFHAVLLIVIALEVWSMINAIRRRRIVISHAFNLKFLGILAFPPTYARGLTKKIPRCAFERVFQL